MVGTLMLLFYECKRPSQSPESHYMTDVGLSRMQLALKLNDRTLIHSSDLATVRIEVEVCMICYHLRPRNKRKLLSTDH